MRRGLSLGGWLAGWLISPATAFALGAAVVTAIWSVVDGLPAAAIFVLVLGAAAFAFACALGATALWDRWSKRTAPLGVIGRNLHSFHPDENLDLIIGTLVITNRTADRNLNVEVAFSVPLTDGPKVTAQTLPPSFVALNGLTHPVLSESPVVIPPQASHSGDFAAWVGSRDVELEKVVAVVHDLVSGRRVQARFF